MNTYKEKVMAGVFFLSALMAIMLVLLICIFLFGRGLPAIREIGSYNFLLGKVWAPSNVPQSFGILPMILGSIYVTIGAITVGVPIGILTALFLAWGCPKKVYGFIKPVVDLLAGIPSVVYGFFGMIAIVPLVRQFSDGSGFSIAAASVLLGIMILPTIIGISEVALRAVPSSYYEGAVALGASHERSLFFVMLPAAKSGVIASVVLGVGRAIGETMAVVMVAGNQARMPKGLFRGVRTMTANVVLEMGYAAELHQDALIATGLVLFVFILVINIGFALLRKRMSV